MSGVPVSGVVNAQALRSLLFVPGSRPERFAKACATAADLVCIDLEDAVGPDDKDAARDALIEFVANPPRGGVGVRMNALTTPAGVADANALIAASATGSLAFVMLPKVEHVEVVDWAAQLFSAANVGADVPLVPIVESARGLSNAESVFAHPRVSCGLFGAVDYSADVGCDLSFAALQVPRVALINAAAIHGVTLFDVPYVDVRNLDGLATEIAATRALGMRARSAIHPAQVDVIHSALAPSEAEVANARRVVEAFEAANGGVALLDGQLIELPIIKAAQRMLAIVDQGDAQ